MSIHFGRGVVPALAGLGLLLWSGMASAQQAGPAIGIVSNGGPGTSANCLGIVGQPRAGAAVTTVPCNGGAPMWRPLPDGSIAYNDYRSAPQFCLDADTGHPANWNKVQIWSCGGAGPNQQWIWQKDGTISLKSKGLCIAPAAPGTQLTIAGCNAGTQSWLMSRAVGTIASAKDAGKCLSLAGNPVAGMPVVEVDCAAAPLWELTNHARLTDANYAGRIGFLGGLTGVGPSQCIDADTGHPINWNKVQVWNCAGSTDVNQVWIWDRKTTIKLNSKGTCITPNNGQGQLTIGACNAGAQSWILK